VDRYISNSRICFHYFALNLVTNGSVTAPPPKVVGKGAKPGAAKSWSCARLAWQRQIKSAANTDVRVVLTPNDLSNLLFEFIVLDPFGK